MHETEKLVGGNVILHFFYIIIRRVVVVSFSGKYFFSISKKLLFPSDLVARCGRDRIWWPSKLKYTKTAESVNKTNRILDRGCAKLCSVFFIFLHVPLLSVAAVVPIVSPSQPYDTNFTIPPGVDVVWGFWDNSASPPSIVQAGAQDIESLKALWNNDPWVSISIGNCVSRTTYAYACDSYLRSNGGFFETTIIVAGYCPSPSRFLTSGTILGGGCYFPVPTEDIIPEKNIGEPCNCVGNPINPGNGNKFQVEHDYSNAGLIFDRYFDSGQLNSPLTTLGKNWRHYFDRRISYSGGFQVPNGVVNVIRKDGKSFRFALTNGVWTSDADVSDQLLSISAADGSISGWQYMYDINKIDTFDATGRLISVGERSGYTQNLTYSDATTLASIAPAPGLLISIIDSFGRRLAFTYDANGRMATMTAPDGSVHQYGYDTNNNLATVTRPDTKVRRYLYENTKFKNFLTGVIDENGSRFATWGYDDATRRAISSEHAGGAERVTLNYQAANTVVTDARGAANTYGLQTVQGVVKTNSISSPAGTNATTFDANGNVASRTDFNGNKTCYAYDLARNLETVRVEGLPSSVDCSASLSATTLATPARKITTQWSSAYRLPTGIAESKRITSFTYDTSGNLLTKTVQATNDTSGAQGFSATVIGSPKKWTYTYNQYGQVLTATGPRTDIADKTTYTYDSQGNLTTVTNALGHVTTLSNYDANGRVGRIVDANGLTTDMTYSLRGWLTSKTVGGETTSYDYDGVGQLKKVTLPDASSINYTYDDAYRLTAIADNAGNSIVYTLDAMGNRTKEEVKDTNGTLVRQTSRIYDALNRLQQITGAQQ